MFFKTTIALAATLIAAGASMGNAQESDPNPLNRYPSHNGPVAATQSALHSPLPGLGRQHRTQPRYNAYSGAAQQHDKAGRVVDGGGF